MAKEYYLNAGDLALMEAGGRPLCQVGPFPTLMHAQGWRCLVTAKHRDIGMNLAQGRDETLVLVEPPDNEEED